MQCKYNQILLGQTYEWSLWRGGHFIEVVFKTGLTVVNTFLRVSTDTWIDTKFPKRKCTHEADNFAINCSFEFTWLVIDGLMEENGWAPSPKIEIRTPNTEGLQEIWNIPSPLLQDTKTNFNSP